MYPIYTQQIRRNTSNLGPIFKPFQRASCFFFFVCVLTPSRDWVQCSATKANGNLLPRRKGQRGLRLDCSCRLSPHIIIIIISLQTDTPPPPPHHTSKKFSFFSRCRPGFNLLVYTNENTFSNITARTFTCLKHVHARRQAGISKNPIKSIQFGSASCFFFPDANRKKKHTRL